jgi:hypothetical protein
MDRYKMGVENIRRADQELNSEKEKLNEYIMTNFNGITNKIKRVMGDEKSRILKALDEFDKPVPVAVEKKTHITLFKPPVSRV